MLSFELTSDSPNRTKLRFSDSLFGRVTDDFVRSVDSGWQLLFSTVEAIFGVVEYPSLRALYSHRLARECFLPVNDVMSILSESRSALASAGGKRRATLSEGTTLSGGPH